MNILLLEENEVDLAASDPRVRHVRKVLRLGVGDRLRAGIVNGVSGTAVINVLDDRGMRVRFEPDERIDQPGPPQPTPVDLLLGHPRPIVLRRLLRDLSTIGIRRLIVVPTELGERSYLTATMWRDIRPLLIEGAAQAGVTRLMEVERCRSLADGIRTASAVAEAEQMRVVLHPTADRTLRAALDAGSAGSLLLAVGSERGWTGKELELLTDANLEVAGMGERTLRTETAAVVAGWMALAAFAT